MCALTLQVRVGRPEVLLDGLEPGRDYDVWVQSLRGAEASEGRGVRARTRECLAPSGCHPLALPGRGPLWSPEPSTQWRMPDPTWWPH